MSNFVINENLLTMSDNWSVDAQKVLAIGLDDLPRFVYMDNGQKDLHFVQFFDADGENILDTIISSVTGSAFFYNPVLKIGSDGFARIVVGKHPSSGAEQLHAFICTNDSGSLNTDIILASPVNSVISMALDSDDNIFAAYPITSSKTINLARCDADGSNISTQVLTTYPSLTSGEIPLFIASDGFARLVYYERLGGPPNTQNLHFVKCNNLSGSSITDTVIVTSIPAIGMNYFSMALSSDDTARILYATGGVGDCDLKFMKCNNQTCTSVTINTLLHEDDSFFNNMPMQLGKDGFARLAYNLRQLETPIIKFLRLTADDGSSFESTTIDPAPYGNYVSMALSLRDLGQMVYVAPDRNTIRFARFLPGILPTYNPSIITTVKKITQELSFPKFIIAGKGGANEDQFKLFKKSDNYGFSVWRSKVEQIGHDFDVKNITMNLLSELTNDTEIIPVLYFDNETIISVGKPINNTNYTSANKFIELTSKNFYNKVSGKENVFLEFQFTGSDLVTIALPIFMELEVHE